jgi:hypothetical protein
MVRVEVCIEWWNGENREGGNIEKFSAKKNEVCERERREKNVFLSDNGFDLFSG